MTDIENSTDGLNSRKEKTEGGKISGNMKIEK